MWAQGPNCLEILNPIQEKLSTNTIIKGLGFRVAIIPGLLPCFSFFIAISTLRFSFLLLLVRGTDVTFTLIP